MIYHPTNSHMITGELIIIVFMSTFTRGVRLTFVNMQSMSTEVNANNSVNGAYPALSLTNSDARPANDNAQIKNTQF